MRGSILLAAVAACLVSVGATAQETGSRIFRGTPADISSDLSKDDQARVTLVDFAGCLADRNRGAVERVLTLPPGGQFDAAAAHLSTDECLRQGQLRFKPALLRGPLYIALYRRDIGSRPPALRADPVDFAASANLPLNDPERPSFMGRYAFSDCVVRRAPAAAHALVLSQTASRYETSAIAALSPSLGPCLPAGTQFRINKLILTGLLAETLYKDAASSTAKPGN